jgi:hypothetical protein
MPTTERGHALKLFKRGRQCRRVCLGSLQRFEEVGLMAAVHERERTHAAQPR